MSKPLPSTDDMRLMALAIDAFNGKSVRMTADEWVRAEALLEDSDALLDAVEQAEAEAEAENDNGERSAA